MSITTETTSTTTHRATLAGGIKASIEPAVFGYVLTIADELRALTLTLLPDQVEEMATWEARDVNTWEGTIIQPNAPRDLDANGFQEEPISAVIYEDVAEFCEHARMRAWGYSIMQQERDDIATLYGLACAVLAKEAQS